MYSVHSSHRWCREASACRSKSYRQGTSRFWSETSPRASKKSWANMPRGVFSVPTNIPPRESFPSPGANGDEPGIIVQFLHHGCLDTIRGDPRLHIRKPGHRHEQPDFAPPPRGAGAKEIDSPVLLKRRTEKILFLWTHDFRTHAPLDRQKWRSGDETAKQESRCIH